jgi:hypothetical protein
MQMSTTSDFALISRVEQINRPCNIIIEIIKQGIKKKIFNKVDPELCFATIIGTIHHLMLSKLLRENIYGGKEKKDPIPDPSFQKRVTNHIKQIIENHLIPPHKIKSI